MNVVRKNIQLSLHVVMVAVKEKRLTEQNLEYYYEMFDDIAQCNIQYIEKLPTVLHALFL